VIFSCNVSDARLFVDKKEIGTASDIKKLTYGYHEVRFEADGFRECSSVIEVNQPRQSFEFKMVAEKRMFTVKGIEFAMVPVKGGTFSMGAIAQHNEEQTDKDEVLQVFLSDYNIGETEVTQALWNAVMGSIPSYFKGANLPVESITWNDCELFIRRLNRLTGENFRMPTEAEWEYAARGGILSRGYRYSGSNNIDDVSWYAENSELKSHEVATKASNELGIYDMSGNVWEWTSDYWRRNYNSKRSGFSRVYRGGSWNDAGGGSRVLYRNRYDPTGKDYDIGLRLAL
jgi:formylglycine-generating enzyme required for sulfatase activity